MRLSRRLSVSMALISAVLGPILWFSFIATSPASAQVAPTPPSVTLTVPTTTVPGDGKVSLGVDLGSLGDGGTTTKGEKPSKSIVILLGLTVLAIAPSLVVLMTSFTRMVVVLGLARNAIGMQTVPPNQVLTGLAIFLSLFVMAPTLKQINDTAWQPYQHGEITQSQALKAAEKPIKTWMLKNTRTDELNLMLNLSKSKRPQTPADTSLTVVIPAFVLSELTTAFIIGVMILLPFLVIDLVVSSGLMSLGMMMLPPVFVSLPFKLLLFVMVDGWGMIAHALVANYH
jgi:flagellar biosynthetic protein FliP